METHMKTAIILGGNGFIGHHMARRLRKEGYWVRVVDIKEYEYGEDDYADEVVIGDLRDFKIVSSCLTIDVDEDENKFPYRLYSHPFTKQQYFDEVYAFACQMGGAGYVFTGDNDAEIMYDSTQIDLNILKCLKEKKFGGKIFYSSSACAYPQGLQHISDVNGLKEASCYPADPDSEYGWQKIYSERLYLTFARNHKLNVRIARFHNIYGPEGTYKGGREKAPAAMCRKVIEAREERHRAVGFYKIEDGIYAELEIWGDGKQTRSFLYIDDCIEAVRQLMESEYNQPVNIGSEEMVSINDLGQMAIDIGGKYIKIKNVPSNALGVRGRNSDNTLIYKLLSWRPKYTLRQGMEKTFSWIKSRYGV